MTDLSKLTFRNLDEFITYHFDNDMLFEKPIEPKNFDEFITYSSEQTQYNLYYNQLTLIPYTIRNKLNDMSFAELEHSINKRTFLKNYILDNDGDFLGVQFSMWLPDVYGICYLDTVANTIEGRCKNVNYLVSSLHDDTLTSINIMFKRKLYNSMMKKLKQ